MFKHLINIVIFSTFFFILFSINTNVIIAAQSKSIIITDDTTKEDMYPAIDMIKDYTRELTIEDVVSEDFADQYIQNKHIEQDKGFFETANWLRFDIKNDSNQSEWLLEFAFPLIHEYTDNKN